jgi:hypothetical protein
MEMILILEYLEKLDARSMIIKSEEELEWLIHKLSDWVDIVTRRE